MLSFNTDNPYYPDICSICLVGFYYRLEQSLSHYTHLTAVDK